MNAESYIIWRKSAGDQENYIRLENNFFFLFVGGNFVSRFNDYFLAFEYYKAEFDC